MSATEVRRDKRHALQGSLNELFWKLDLIDSGYVLPFPQDHTEIRDKEQA